MARWAGIDYRESSMAQTSFPILLIDYFRRPDTLIIPPAMLDGLEHPFNPWFRVVTKNSGNAAHG